MDDAYASLKAAAERIQKAAQGTLAQSEEVGHRAGRIQLAVEEPAQEPAREAAPPKGKPHPPAPPRPEEGKQHSLSDLVLEKLTKLLS